jgi:hypothetical protein
MTRIAIIAAVAAAALSTGCATITRGTTQSVAVTSEPQGADITSSTGPGCRAPCALELKRNSNHTLTAKLDGYESEQAVVTKSVSGGGAAGMAGNLVVGGIIGAGIDATSGAMYDLSPSAVAFYLKREDEL